MSQANKPAPDRESSSTSPTSSSPDADAGKRGPSLAARLSDPWVGYVLPLAVFMLAGSLEPTDPQVPLKLLGLSIPYSAYPLVYTAKIVAVMVAMAVVWPVYRQFRTPPSALAIGVGVVGVVLWIGLTKLGFEDWLFKLLGRQSVGQRSAFDPFEHWPDNRALAWSFLAVRFWGLAAIVPVIEEFFLRGFVIRFVVASDWPKVAIGALTPLAAAVGTILPVAMHPGEMLAAAVWFSLITWLGWKTRNIWDCVAAHAVTNLLLGIYVVATGEWQFW